MLATVNSGAAPFSLTLISALASPTPTVKRIDVNASFMGVTFSKDSRRVYLSGGENGNIWVADTTLGRIVGSVNLNGAEHQLDRRYDMVATPAQRFKGAFPATWSSARTDVLFVVDRRLPTSTSSTSPGSRRVSTDRAASRSRTTSRRSSVGSRSGGIPMASLSRPTVARCSYRTSACSNTRLQPENPTGEQQRRLPALLSRRRVSDGDEERPPDRHHESRCQRTPGGRPARCQWHSLRIRGG